MKVAHPLHRPPQPCADPNNWNDSDIMKAIKQITKSPNDKYFIEEREAFEYIGEHRGVKMMVIINKDNELQTAYPLLQ